MAKRKRIVFIKKEKGRSLMGVTQLQFVRDGARIDVEKGGGTVGSMYYSDGMIVLRKVDDKGQPCRNFGSVMVGERKVPLIADGAIFPAHVCEAMLFVEEDDGEEEPAKPVQQNQGNQRK
jgi:hypothetical protein